MSLIRKVNETMYHILLGLIIAGMLFVPSQCAAVGVPTPVTIPGAVSTVSAATVQKLGPSGSRFINDQVTPALLGTAAGSLSVMFAEWNQSGFTASLQAYLLANPSLILTAPSAATIQSQWKNISASFPGMTESEYSNMVLATTTAERQEFYNALKNPSIGLQGIHNQIIANLESASARLIINGSGAHFVQAGEGCGLAFGFGGLYAAVLALACPPLGAAMAVVGLAISIGGLYC